MAAKFEISKDHAGKFRFHLKAPNGEIIAASQGYESKANAEKGIEAIKTHAPKAKGRRPQRNLEQASRQFNRCGSGLQCGGASRWEARPIFPQIADFSLPPFSSRHHPLVPDRLPLS